MIVMPDADLDQAADALVGAAYGSAGERCMAISVAVAVGNATADDADRASSKPRIAALQMGARHESQRRTWPARHGAHLDTRQRLRCNSARPRARSWSSTAAHDCAPPRRRLLPRRLPLRSRQAGDAYLQAKRSLGPCSASCAPTTSKPPSSSSTSTSSATAHPSSRVMAIQRETSRTECRPAWLASTCQSPSRWRSTASADGSVRFFGDHAVHGAEGVRFYTRMKTITARWPTGIRIGVDTSMPTLG